MVQILERNGIYDVKKIRTDKPGYAIVVHEGNKCESRAFASVLAPAVALADCRMLIAAFLARIIAAHPPNGAEG